MSSGATSVEAARELVDVPSCKPEGGSLRARGVTNRQHFQMFRYFWGVNS